MKIAILTLSLYANYGGNLQAYALLTALKEMGHDAWYLNRERHRVPSWRVPVVLAKRMFKKFVLGGKVKLRSGLFNQRERAIVAKHSREFIGTYIQPQTPEFLSTASLVKGFGKLDFDAVIVGSDQVWRQRFVKENLTDYFLGFLAPSDSTTKRISYAASFGTSEWEYSDQETKECRALIQRFDAVSVRESSGVELCEQKFGRQAEHVIDPTMLLTASHYTALIPNPGERFNGILVYILDLDDEKKKVIDAVAEKLGLPVFQVNGNAADRSAPPHLRVAPPVEEWLRGFRDAQFVITDSFHGSVFSIIFNKPFLAYGNPTRGMARFSSLLDMFGLGERLISSSADLNDDHFSSPDWERVNARLSEEQQHAKSFLKKALE